MTTTAQQAYQQLLTTLAARGGEGIAGYWSVGPTSYQRGAGGDLTAQHCAQPGLRLVRWAPATPAWTTPTTSTAG